MSLRPVPTNSAEPAARTQPKTSAPTYATYCLMLFLPGTFFGRVAAWLYFVIHSISTSEDQLTARRYRVSSKREK